MWAHHTGRGFQSLTFNTLTFLPNFIDRPLRRAGNATLDAYGHWRAQRYDVSQTIIVACTGRGGSTWLAQILASLPGYHMLWEQLHWRSNPECTKYGFGRPLYISEGTSAPRRRRYIKQVLNGEKLSTGINTSRYFHPKKLLFLQGYVVKLVTVNMMLPWILSAFPVQAVYMIRHPCAVVSSQLIHGEWDITKDFCKHEKLFDDEPHLRGVFESIDNKEELLAFNWAIQNYIPLRQPRPYPWVLTTYERMVDEGMNEVGRIFGCLNKQVPKAAFSQLHRPSETTAKGSRVSRNQNRLTGWKKKLTPQQADDILRTVHEVGVDWYTDELVPDYDKLDI